MPVFSPGSAVRPREELSLAIAEGEGAVKNLIGSKLLGDLPINRRTAHLIKLFMADTLGRRTIDDPKFIHAPGTKYERVSATIGDFTLGVDLRGLEIIVPNEVALDYADYLDIETLYSSRFGNEISALTKEKLIAAAIFSTSNFGSATNSTVAYTVANLATISFFADVIASTRRLKAKGEPGPYKCTMSGPVFERIRQAATVQSYAAGTLKAGQEATKGVIEEALKEFGIDELLIGDSYWNSGQEPASAGTAPTLTQVWSNTYIWVGTPGMAGGTGDSGVGVPTIGGVGANVFWEGFLPGGVPSVEKKAITFAGGNYVESYPDLSIDSMIVRVKMSQRPTITNARAGDLIATQYS